MATGSVVLLYQGDAPHPAHKTFGDAVNAMYRHFETGAPIGGNNPDSTGVPVRIRTGLTLSRSFDTVIAEGSAPLQTALVYRARNPDTRLLYLAADETFYTLSGRRTRHLWPGLKPLVQSFLDGIVAVSELAYEWGRPYLGSHPYVVVHPPIPEGRYNHLRSASIGTSGDSTQILTVGEARETKNHAALVEAVGRVRETVDIDVTVTLIGTGHRDREYANREYVRTPGFVDDDELCRTHERSDVYVQPSVADAYPVASLEGMLSGTPTVVTTGVGTKHRLSREHVCEPTVTGLREALLPLVRANEATRVDIGRTLRKSVEGLTEAAQGAAFADAIKSEFES